MAQNYILYQAYGNKDVLNEAIYSILSFHNQKTRPEVTFVVYTDDPAYYEGKIPEGVIFESLTQEKLTRWKGPTNFHHRVKVEMIIDFFSKYDGNLLYVDTDTCFKADPAPLFDGIDKGKVFMHVCEGRIDKVTDNLVFKKLVRFLKGHAFKLKDGSDLVIPADIYMWNAGVLGFNKSVLPKVKEVLELTDVVHQQYEKYVMEQFVFSYVLQNNYTLHEAEPYIYHYWNFKEFRTVIKELLDQFKGAPVKLLAESCARISVESMAEPKQQFESLPKWQKKMKKIFKLRTWEMPRYRFWDEPV